MTSTIQLVKTLKEGKYSFDSSRNTWICGRKPIDEEDVLIYLIRYAKSQNIRNAGEWAESALESAKSDPEITTSAFMKARMVRNRNRRIAGKYLFLNWARAVGITIPDGGGELEMYMRRHSLVVRRFYDEIAAGYNCCKKRARIAGKVLRSVFIGWELRDEDTDAADRAQRRAPKPVPPPPLPINAGLQRYNEFMTKLFSSDP